MGKIREKIENLNNQIKINQMNSRDKSIKSDISRLEQLMFALIDEIDKRI